MKFASREVCFMITYIRRTVKDFILILKTFLKMNLFAELHEMTIFRKCTKQPIKTNMVAFPKEEVKKDTGEDSIYTAIPQFFFIL